MEVALQGALGIDLGVQESGDFKRFAPDAHDVGF